MVKFVVDAVVGTAIALILTPVILALACVSAVVYRANPFFVQDRIGKGGRQFRFVKIRSLPVDTPSSLSKDRLTSVENTRWGRFIRSHHLDELPQVWHVVTGKMSLVGPRPEMPALESAYSAAHRAARHSVRPGCTGLWQVSVASAGLIKDAPEFDIHYVEKWSIRLDVWILLKTFKELLGARPIGTLEVIPAWVTRAT